MSKLKVGLIVDSGSINSYTHRLLQLLLGEPELFERPVLFTLKGTVGSAPFADVRDSKELAAFKKVILKLELGSLLSESKQSDFLKAYSPDELPVDQVAIEPTTVSGSRVVHDFSDAALEQVRAQQCNVLVRCCDGALTGVILECAPFGVLSILPRDSREHRSHLIGFWEAFNKRPSCGFEIHRLKQEPSAGALGEPLVGDLLKRGNVMGLKFWLTCYGQIQLRSHGLLFKVIRQLATTGSLPEPELNTPNDQQIYAEPSKLQLAQYGMIWFANRVKIKLDYLKGYQTSWAVSFVPQPAFDLELANAIRIENPPNRFLADPFVIEHNGKTYCFLEDYFYAEAKGKVSVYELDGEQYKDLGVILDEPFHLSYPFVFKHDDTFYMVPEIGSSNQIRLYRCDDFPLKWTHIHNLMEDVNAADTILMQEGGKWIMLTNLCSAGSSDHQSELHGFYADDLMGEWTPFDNNPIILDSQRARNGGFFEMDGKRYRINQVHGQGHYGQSFNINEILEIGPNTLVEKKMGHVSPDFLPHIDSTHHFHSNGTYTVFDYAHPKRIKL